MCTKKKNFERWGLGGRGGWHFWMLCPWNACFSCLRCSVIRLIMFLNFVSFVCLYCIKFSFSISSASEHLPWMWNFCSSVLLVCSVNQQCFAILCIQFCFLLFRFSSRIHFQHKRYCKGCIRSPTCDLMNLFDLQY